MEKSKDLLLAIIKYLVSHGYPEDSLVLEWPINKKHRVDLAVINPDTNEPIALFELKRTKNQKSMIMAISQLEIYSKILKENNVPVYIVFGKKGNPPFEINYLNKKQIGKEKNLTIALEKVPIKINGLPDFSIFKRSKTRKNIFHKIKKRDDISNWLHGICWVFAVLTIFLLLLDLTEIIIITTERLALIAITITLIIIPFASKLKILGIEFQSLEKQTKKT